MKKIVILFIIWFFPAMVEGGESRTIGFNLGLDLGYTDFWQPREVEAQPGIGRAVTSGQLWPGILLGFRFYPFTDNFILGYNLEKAWLESQKSEVSATGTPNYDWRKAKTRLDIDWIHEIFLGWDLGQIEKKLADVYGGFSFSTADVSVWKKGIRYLPKNINGEIVYQPKKSLVKYKGNIFIISPTIAFPMYTDENEALFLQAFIDFGNINYHKVDKIGHSLGVRIRIVRLFPAIFSF